MSRSLEVRYFCINHYGRLWRPVQGEVVTFLAIFRRITVSRQLIVGVSSLPIVHA